MTPMQTNNDRRLQYPFLCMHAVTSDLFVMAADEQMARPAGSYEAPQTRLGSSFSH